MSNGEETGSAPVKKKKRGFAAMKERYENEIRELRAKLGTLDGPRPLAEILDDPKAETPVLAGIPSAGKDCLGFITKETPYVGLASTYSYITLRPGNAKMNPPLQTIRLLNESSGVWEFCPFMLGDPRSEENDQRIRLMNSKWWFHILTRETAATVWADERFPRPVHTVIDPAKFKGWDASARTPRGEVVEINEFEFVPLREATRIVLMRLRSTFLDYGRRPAGLEFDPRIVNPYRNKVSGLKLADIPRGKLTQQDLA